MNLLRIARLALLGTFDAVALTAALPVLHTPPVFGLLIILAVANIVSVLLIVHPTSGEVINQ